MSGFELSAREKLECMEFFSKGLTPSKNFVYAGFFYPVEDNLREGLAILLDKLIKNPKDWQTLQKEFNEFIEKKEYKLKGQAIYLKDKVLWYKPRELFKKDRNAFFYRQRKDKYMHIRAGEVSTYGKFSKSSGLVFLRLITPPETGEEKLSKEKVWELRKTLLRLWKDLTNDNEVKSYLHAVISFSERLESDLAPGDFKSPPISKLLSCLAPFDFSTFENAILLSRARLFRREKTPDELLQEIERYSKSLWEDVKYAIEEKLLKDLLNKACDEKFLERLRRDWKEVLKELLKGGRKDKTVGVFVQKGQQVEGKLSYGVFSIPEKEVEVFVFYEKSLEEKLEGFKKGFEKAIEEYQKFTGGIKLSINKKFSLDHLIPHFEELKKIDYSKGELGLHESKILLFDLLYFIARLKGFVELSKERKKPHAILLLLDTDVREANGSYPFWDHFSLAYDFFSLPVQTLNKQTINNFVKYGEGKVSGIQGIYKNLFISLMKDLKSLEFDFEDFKVPEELTVYVILEKPSAGFCYERFNPNNQKVFRHYLYEAYLVHIKGSKVRIEIDDKFIVLAGGVDFERDRIIKWIEDRVGNNKRFCFITASKKEESFINDIISRSSQEERIRKQSIFVEYDEIPIAYISEKASEDCFVIYTSEFENLKKELKINTQKHTVSIALKPADPKNNDQLSLNGEWFYHSALQVFSTEGPGWEKDEVYMEKKSLFLLTILALSQYESESFQTPYAKLELWQKKKNLYIKLRRSHGDYTMGLSGILYELLYLASKIPGDKNIM
ncbi:hypothetical protein [Hydrogenobacter hydrogenophilus]|uniref:Uncharacterized protein n=1 Tax=Hydrogenobacter hydrogenophilus TaxID=35835 RepID=A0A285NVT1_9AQUI|nr:hypothetical protein [Hydrogenobacter hydrogenophilus]SNZ13549.1 hypothetical protein SAMN06265353_0781 [Hydrogenobacter hydrogenophilus]